MSSQPSGRPAQPGLTETGAPAAQPHGLKANALKAGDVVVLSLASSGPTQSIAVTLAALLATIGYASFLPLLICFIPMLGIAIGCQRLNAWRPSAGATYSSVGRALNPHAGFFAGSIMANAGNFFLGGILPGLGAAFMAFVIIYSLATDSLNGVEIAFGFGFAVFGLVLSVIAQRVGKSSFYSDPRSSHGDTVEAELAGS